MIGVALDIGTSGLRAQAINLENGKVISTAITLRHPLPGINVIDHLTFAIEYGQELAHTILIDTIEKLLEQLQGIKLSDIKRIAVSGNPTQLSIFQGIEIRDLAWAGEKALNLRGVIPPKRNAIIRKAEELGIKNISPDIDVCIPPCIKHELGADAVAMMVKSGFLEKDLALVVDYGTNAEMALKVGDNILTSSAAAGPAIEGQHIEKGMLASPGAISDFIYVIDGWRCNVLDENMFSKSGDVVNMNTGHMIRLGEMHGKAKGITGTGLIAAIAVGMINRLIIQPYIKTKDKKLHFQDGIYITEKDIEESGKALGAFRAGFLTLAEEAGIAISDVKTIFMAGASGFYVDPIKARISGMIPQSAKEIYQVGNTSLSLAVDIVKNPEYLYELQSFVNKLRSHHILFATSDVFKNTYVLELAYWTEGMPLEKYNKLLKSYKIKQKIILSTDEPKIIKIIRRDIENIGKYSLKVVSEIKTIMEIYVIGCNECKKCMENCPEGSIISVENEKMKINTSLCLGTACRRCISACQERFINFKNASVLSYDT
ncbi:MAG: methylamine methyltransferase corrinoid protein reductive activase [Methanosarcinales archaeon]|nr:methylamine methyltransferase corrinoid protein reductive activase [Methanosarcinales archaeon]